MNRSQVPEPFAIYLGIASWIESYKRVFGILLVDAIIRCSVEPCPCELEIV